VNAREWIDAYAAELGIDPPTAEEFSTLLELAGEAAHSSERVAAPVACWLSAHAGRTPEESLEIARRVAAAEPD
jgi:Domain of unknown function (DUF6457)